MTIAERVQSLPVDQAPVASVADPPPTRLHALARPKLESARRSLEVRLIQRAQRRSIRVDAIQRGFDLVVGSVALVTTMPLMLLVAAAVRADSPGPVIFRQTRITRRGKSFECLKFRTMVPDAESQLAAILAQDDEARASFEADFKLMNDPRISRVGRFLRRSSLDELPQLVNVLRGEMSIVGPRPLVPEELWRYGDYGQVVLQVRPGMTGPWQVNGRNAISYTRRVRLDVDHALNRSLSADIGIVLRTFRCIVNPGPEESR